jgi:hypothetical protein
LRRPEAIHETPLLPQRERRPTADARSTLPLRLELGATHAGLSQCMPFFSIIVDLAIVYLSNILRFAVTIFFYCVA